MSNSGRQIIPVGKEENQTVPIARGKEQEEGCWPECVRKRERERKPARKEKGRIMGEKKNREK